MILTQMPLSEPVETMKTAKKGVSETPERGILIENTLFRTAGNHFLD